MTLGGPPPRPGRGWPVASALLGLRRPLRLHGDGMRLLRGRAQRPRGSRRLADLDRLRRDRDRLRGVAAPPRARRAAGRELLVPASLRLGAAADGLVAAGRGVPPAGRRRPRGPPPP